MLFCDLLPNTMNKTAFNNSFQSIGMWVCITNKIQKLSPPQIRMIPQYINITKNKSRIIHTFNEKVQSYHKKFKDHTLKILKL